MKEKTYYEVIAEMESKRYDKLENSTISWGYMRGTCQRVTK